MDVASGTYYEAWMESEGIPIVRGFGVSDLREVETKPWPRMGGEGAFLQLAGMEGLTGAYVLKLAPGASTHRGHHLYQVLYHVVEGGGELEVEPWDGGSVQRRSFGPGALFAIPLNASYRLRAGEAGARLLAVTDAPMLMDIFHSAEFLFGDSFAFRDRYDGASDYFTRSRKYLVPGGMVWETNFIEDAKAALLDPEERKGTGVKITHFEMADNSLGGHLAGWPSGRYHKAHYHAGGAVLHILQGEGYSLMWPVEWGMHPFQDGWGDQVVRVDWRPGAVFCPPSKWFHQHFNVGAVEAKQLALRWGSKKHPTGFHLHLSGAKSVEGLAGVFMNVKEGGTLIEYEDEDPAIRQIWEEELAKRGLTAAR